MLSGNVEQGKILSLPFLSSNANSPVLTPALQQPNCVCVLKECSPLPLCSKSQGTLRIFYAASLHPSPHPFVSATNTRRHYAWKPIDHVCGTPLAMCEEQGRQSSLSFLSSNSSSAISSPTPSSLFTLSDSYFLGTWPNLLEDPAFLHPVNLSVPSPFQLS